jgi:uncharacterized circularly permuted ATP-grasp superfamily protein
MDETHELGQAFREGDPDDRDDLTREVNRLLEEQGVRFGGDEGHPFRVDPVPRVIAAAEWEVLSAGIGQRVRALDLLLEDLYGDRTVVEAGVLPERVVTGSPYLERDLGGLAPASGARISVAGLDLVRGADGAFRVLEDNVRTPSGMAYAIAVSEAVASVLGVDRPGSDLAVGIPAALRHCLEASAPDVEGALVLLTDGPTSTAYYEHRRLAQLADLTLVHPADLRADGDLLRLASGERVRALYRRTDDDSLRDGSGELTEIAQLLLPALRAGSVGLANWFGTGVADDKSVYAYVEDLVRHFLDEEPLIGSVPTYDLAQPDQLADVLERLDELVVKPRDGYGGAGVVVGPAASVQELDRAREELRRAPEVWVAQEVVKLSTHATVVDGELEPRHVDLRPFAFYDGESVTVPTGGLTRVALQAGEMVVNSSRDGGGKATWVE